ncbi:MAG: HEAT repeat domain-containing protein [Planctomycetota bacterium]|nr:MAG: HEAT repeat domain-containing protein [Planctomycetota bacterium]
MSLVLRLLAALSASLALCAGMAAHGGTYAGPGATVPLPSGPATSPVAPAAPPPATPGPLPAAPGVAGGPSGAVTAVVPGPDNSAWQSWWEFNKEAFLQRKSARAGGALTGEGELLVGLSGVSARSGAWGLGRDQVQQVVVPALLRALENEDNKDLVSACLVALSKAGGDPQIPALLRPFLGHDDQEIAETAALCLGILAVDEDVPLLEAIVQDGEEGRRATTGSRPVPVRTRAFAAYGLGMIGATSADRELQRGIAVRLVQTLEQDESALADLRVACVIAIGLAGAEAQALSLETLGAWLRDPRREAVVRAQAPQSMARLLRAGSASASERAAGARLLLDLLADKDTPNEVLQSCCQALGALTRGSDPFAAEVVQGLLRVDAGGHDAMQRNFALMSLAAIAADPAGERNLVTGTVAEYLLRRLDSGSKLRAEWSGLALGVLAFRLREGGAALGPVAAERMHAKFRSEKSPSSRSCYALALGLMHHAPAAAAIRDALVEARDPEFRGYAALALGLLQAREYRDELRGLVGESKRLPGLLAQATVALGLLGDADVTDTLLALMQPADGSSPPLSVLAAAASALGYTGDARALGPLTRLLADGSRPPLARAFAAVALGMLADERLLPWNQPIVEHRNYHAVVDTLLSGGGSSGVLDIL